ncbi:MAG: carbamoyl phosphate synthase small subunit [Firmicutes bacterium]|nr:carbamoyl phosphate synthase small subunit [Bacillota bacterium]
MEQKKKKLVLDNGAEFFGTGFGGEEERIADIVFNTSMVGYQEIISDPASFGKIIVMSYPLIGNYGLTDEDYESKIIAPVGLVVREYNDTPSNFRFTRTLGDVLSENRSAGLSGVDTRAIIRIIRKEGGMRGMIANAERPTEDCVNLIKAHVRDCEKVKKVSSKTIWFSKTRNPQYTVALLDLGVTRSVIRTLNDAHANVVVVPYDTAKDIILKYNPDCLLVSDGPGNANDIPSVVSLIKELKGRLPILAMGLGFQAVALSEGAKVVKMHTGHRGANQPVFQEGEGRILITNQNHSYAVDKNSLKKTSLKITNTNVTDGTVEGAEDKSNKIRGVQYRPDENELYKIFTNLMEGK